MTRKRRPPSRKPPAAASWKGKASSSGSAPRSSSGTAPLKRTHSSKTGKPPPSSAPSVPAAGAPKRSGLFTRLAVSAQTAGMGASKKRADDGAKGADRRERAPAEPPAFPPAGVSLARGLTAVGRSPVVLALTFLVVFGIWAVIQSLGVSLAALPSYLAQVGGLPPFSSFLLVQLLQAGLRLRGGIAAVAGIGILVVRAALLATWAVTLVARLRRDAPEVAEDEPVEAVRLGDVLRILPGVLAFEAGFLLVALVGYAIIPSLGPGIGQLGLIAILIATMYFFIFIPLALVTEGGDLRTAVRASIRAARLPGSRHLLFTTGFLMLSIFLSLATPGSVVAVATPSLAVWVYVLFASFIYATVFGAYAFRWLVVRDRVMDEVAARAGANGTAGRPTSRTGGGVFRRGS